MEQKEWVDTKPIEQLVGELGAHSVFGEPTREQDVVVIPVAQVAFGFGYGGGYGTGPAKPGGAEAAGATPEAGKGGGGGAGAGGRTTPRGYIRITPEGVKYEPNQNEAVIPVAGILMVAWSVFWITATVRYIAKQVAKTKLAHRR
jgi:uncharacterized spore protein YtfJ